MSILDDAIGVVFTLGCVAVVWLFLSTVDISLFESEQVKAQQSAMVLAAQSWEASDSVAAWGTVIGTQSLNIRGCPDISCGIAGRLPEGAKIPILGQSEYGDWIRTEYEDLAGWVSIRYVLPDNLSGCGPTDPECD